MAVSRFQKQFRGMTPVYTCRICQKRTRDTGNDEAGVELCYRCLKVAEAENAASDYGDGSPEHKRALAQVPPEQPAAMPSMAAVKAALAAGYLPKD